MDLIIPKYEYYNVAWSISVARNRGYILKAIQKVQKNSNKTAQAPTLDQMNW